jgi:LPS-assembly protein
LADNLSDYVGRVRLQPVDYVDVTYRFRLDKDNFTPNRSELDAQLGPPALNLRVGYLDLTGESNQNELSNREELTLRLGSRLTENWSVFVGHRRDLRQDTSLVTQAGVTYQDECFLVQAVAQRSFYSDREIEPENSVFVRFVLKYLGEFGNS